MKPMKYLLTSGTFALGMALAASGYHMTINNPTWVNGNELKPGDYRVQMEGNKVMITGRDTSVEAPAKIESAAKKYPTTSLTTDEVNGKRQLQEVDFGGSKTSILFKTGPAGAGGE